MYYESNCSNHCPTKIKTYNVNTHFIAPNPPCSFNPNSIYPCIDTTVYVGSFSSIIGDVTIQKNVFIASNVSIRADEGFPFFIDSDTNIQDGVILHGLAHSRVKNKNKEYSIYIGKHVSCAHGCIIHGPCMIGDNVFVGFNAIVFNAIIGDNCYISTNVLVTDGVIVDSISFASSLLLYDTNSRFTLFINQIYFH